MAKLIFQLTPDESVDFALLPGVTRLGRHPSNEIVINNTWISSRHAQFRKSGGSITVEDAGSSNGTSVNGVAVQSRELQDGDRLSFGQLEAVYAADLPAVAVAVAAVVAAGTPALPPAARPAPAADAAASKATPPVAQPVPVIVRPMAAPPAGIVYGNARREGELELEEWRKKLTSAQAEAATASKEMAAVKMALAETVAASESARRELEGVQAAVTAAQRTRDGLAAAAATSQGDQERLLAEIAASTAFLTTMKQETAQMRAEASQWAERRAAAGMELDALAQRTATAREAACAEDRKMSARLKAVEQLELKHNILSGKIHQWEQQEVAARQAESRLAAAESRAARLMAESEAGTAALTQEAAALQDRLDHLRRETAGAEALNSKVTDLRQQQGEAERRLEFLNDRLAGMSEAPDPNWGTVHSLARSFIKKLDLIDDLIAHLAGQPESAGTLDQLSVFRSGLLDILKEYSIEAYSLEPGTVVDVAARKRIQIVETLSEASHDGTRVVRTYRPGYLCLNGDLGIVTLLRKADVAVSISLS